MKLSWFSVDVSGSVILISEPNHKFISSEEMEGEVYCGLHGPPANGDFGTSCGARARHLT